MNKNQFGVNVKVNGIGNLETRKATLHGAKSLAGKAFHSNAVKSVCVFDGNGTARLYLKKTDNGIVREER